MLAGKKTYLVAVAMIIHAVTGYLLGETPQLDLQEVLTALGLAALRSGVNRRAP